MRPTEQETPCGGPLCDFPRRCYSRHFRDNRSPAPHHHRDKDGASCFATDKFISRALAARLPCLAGWSTREGRIPVASHTSSFITSKPFHNADYVRPTQASIRLLDTVTSNCTHADEMFVLCMYTAPIVRAHLMPERHLGQGLHCQAAGPDRVSTRRVESIHTTSCCPPICHVRTEQSQGAVVIVLTIVRQRPWAVGTRHNIFQYVACARAYLHSNATDYWLMQG
jgi:hypothetical protein